MSRKLLAVLAATGTLAVAGPQLRAQDAQALRARYQISIPQWLVWYEAALRSAPGSGASSPAAFGASFGDFFLGAGFQGTERMNTKSDGAVVGGFGLGSASKTLGLEVAVTSLSTIRHGFGTRTAGSLKLHRILPGMTAIAVGMENAIVSGGTDGGHSLYGVASRVFPLTPDAGRAFSSISVNAGVGNGRFRSADAVVAGRKTAGAFGSVAVRVLPAASVIADWNGQDLTAALSLAPFARLPIVITPSVSDLTGNAGGKRARFNLGLGGGLHVDF